MKKIKLMIGGLLLVLAGTLQAQVVVTATIGNPPPWGPADGAGVRFYYIPDIQAYYDVTDANYVYMSGGRWIHSSNLPHKYRNYDLYGGQKVALRDYHGEKPYENYKDHQRNYPKGYHRGQTQKTFGEKPGEHNDGKHGRN